MAKDKEQVSPNQLKQARLAELVAAKAQHEADATKFAAARAEAERNCRAAQKKAKECAEEIVRLATS